MQPKAAGFGPLTRRGPMTLTFNPILYIHAFVCDIYAFTKHFIYETVYMYMYYMIINLNEWGSDVECLKFCTGIKIINLIQILTQENK